MADLVTQQFLTNSLADFGLTTNQNALLPGLAASASRAIRVYCNRWFNRRTVDELQTVNPRGDLVLREYPVNKISRLCSNPTAVITITNTSASIQDATVEVTTTGDTFAGLVATGINLYSIANGVVANNALLFATYLTVDTLATAVNALGSGWSAVVGQSKWPTAYLRAIQGQLDAQAGASLYDWVDRLPFQVDGQTGIVSLSGPVTDPWSTMKWGPSLETSWGDPEISGAPLGVRIVYDCGFDTVPEDVQQAAAELVKAMLERLKTDATLSSEKAGEGEYSARQLISFLPDSVRENLDMWRNVRA